MRNELYVDGVVVYAETFDDDAGVVEVVSDGRRTVRAMTDDERELSAAAVKESKVREAVASKVERLPFDVSVDELTAFLVSERVVSRGALLEFFGIGERSKRSLTSRVFGFGR